MKISTTCTLMLALLFGWAANAQSLGFTIQGTVSFTNDQIPLPGIEIIWTSDDGTYTDVAISADDGTYSVNFDIPAGDVHTFTGETMDFCTGEIIQLTTDNSADVQIIDVTLCSIVFPPPPVDCEAFFDVERADPSNPLAISFTDLSFSASPINGWAWEFGDGNTSGEQNPTHTYAEVGVYEVLLTIVTDSCTSTTVLPIWVDTTTIIDCICDCEWDPVCVITPDSSLIEFPNPCIAECEGYGPDDFVECTNSCNCTTDWDPVCVNGIAGQILFPNACWAECEGFTPDMFVDCEDDCLCTDEWDPVCVVNPVGEIILFGNACEARCEGYTADDFVDCDNNCVCDDTWDPVCVFTASGEILFPNMCWAECAGYGVDDVVECMDDCLCTDEWDPVCIATPSGGFLLFPNACEAICAGFSPDDFVDCDNDCICDDIWDPVCVQTGAGQELFPNACYAECAGFSPDDFVDCIDDCICTDEWDPVCVLSPSGITLTFGNACLAECEGYGPDDFVECNDNCICDDEWDPVCVTTATGEIQLFPNACYAECEGFTPDDFVDCFNDCLCTDEWDPVCVFDAAGNVLFFPNPCEAECAGYGPDDYEDCNGQDCWVDIFYYQTSPDELTVTFESYVSSDDVLSYLWDFGDGNTSTEANPTHTYAAEGIYDISLTVLTADSCEAHTAIHICIGGGGTTNPPDCQAFFFFEQDPDDLMTFNFLNFSFGNNLSYTWDFGDGNTSDEENPTHTYAEDGAYDVTLTVSNASCASTFQMIVVTSPGTVYGNECTAFFLPIINDEDKEVVLINLSSPDAISFDWDFGDGNSSTEASPVHEYAASGSYDVSLTITTADGCTNSFAMNIDLDDGNFTGSPQFLVLSAKDLDAIQAVALAPNPASTVVRLQFESTQALQADIELVNIAGQLLSSRREQIAMGANTLALNVEQLQSGLYFVRIVSDKGTKSMKLVKE